MFTLVGGLWPGVGITGFGFCGRVSFANVKRESRDARAARGAGSEGPESLSDGLSCLRSRSQLQLYYSYESLEPKVVAFGMYE